jgi:Na+-driven multidrug efflux pump
MTTKKGNLLSNDKDLDKKLIDSIEAGAVLTKANITPESHIFSFHLKLLQGAYFGTASEQEWQAVKERASDLFQKATPGILGACTLYTSSFVCSIFVSQLGIEYIATCGYANRFRFISMNIPSYFFFSLMSPLGSAFQKNKDSNPLPASVFLLASLIWSIPVIGLSALLMSQVQNVLQLFGENKEDSHLVGEYFSWLMLASPAYIWLQIITQTLAAYKRPWLQVYSAVLRTALDISLTYAFVLKSSIGFIGWPIATVIQTWATLLISLALLALPLSEELRGIIAYRPFSRQEITQACTDLYPGISIVLHFSTLALGSLGLTIFSGKLSQDSLAAFGITSSIAYWPSMIVEPLSGIISSMMGPIFKNINLNQDEKKIQAITLYGIASTMAFLMNLPLTLVMIFGHKVLASLYIDTKASDSQQIMHYLSILLPLYATIGPLYSFKNAGIGIMRGNGDTTPGFLIELACCIGIGTVGGAIFTFSKEKTVIGIGGSDIVATVFATFLLALVVQHAVSREGKIFNRLCPGFSRDLLQKTRDSNVSLSAKPVHEKSQTDNGQTPILRAPY